MIAPIHDTTQTEYELSVIVPSVNTQQDLVDCLVALESRTGATLDILVVDRLGESVRAAVRERHPRVRLIGVPHGTTIPQMGAIAFAEARGRWSL